MADEADEYFSILRTVKLTEEKKKKIKGILQQFCIALLKRKIFLKKSVKIEARGWDIQRFTLINNFPQVEQFYKNCSTICRLIKSTEWL